MSKLSDASGNPRNNSPTEDYGGTTTPGATENDDEGKAPVFGRVGGITGDGGERHSAIQFHKY